MKPSTEVDVGECFAPFIPQVSVSAAPKPAPKPGPSGMVRAFDKYIREQGWEVPPPTDTSVEMGTSADTPGAQPSEIPIVPVTAPLPPPRKATAVELVTWIKRSILAQMHLPGDAAESVALWVISTWFQDALGVLPCLVITGPACDAMALLRILSCFCRVPVRVAEFRKGDLPTVNRGWHTALISEPNLNNRNAALLGNLTNPGFTVVADGRIADHAMSRAIYAGENPTSHKIQNSIHFHITATTAAPPSRPEWLLKTIKRIPVHLEQYRETNLDHVGSWQFVPSGLPSETAAIAKAIGSCIVDAPALRQKLVTLLKAQDRQQLSQRSGTTEALVVEAVLLLSRQDREHVFTSEIADEANHLLELRGERHKLSPETVGRRLCQLGLRTHRLSLAGNGLTFNKSTVAVVQQLATVHVEEDLLAGTENLHGSQVPENK